jgi:hypothetical protein
MPKFILGTRHPVRLFLYHEVEAENEKEAKQKAWRTAYELLKALDAVGVRFDESYESSSDDVEFVEVKAPSTIQCLVQCTCEVCECEKGNI